MKNKLVKTLSHKIFVMERGILHFVEKETVKTVSKGRYTYMNMFSLLFIFGWSCVMVDMI